MDQMTVLPTWAVWVVSLGAPVGAVLGVVVSNWVTRRTAGETEQRSRREETMRTLRWAAELAISPDDGRAALGVAELRALSQSEMNDDEQQAFVDAALTQALEGPRSAIEAAELAGQEAEVLVEPPPVVTITTGDPASGVEWGTDGKEAPGGQEDRGRDDGPAGSGEGARRT